MRVQAAMQLWHYTCDDALERIEVVGLLRSVLALAEREPGA